jgi:hypothetical protein
MAAVEAAAAAAATSCCTAVEWFRAVVDWFRAVIKRILVGGVIDPSLGCAACCNLMWHHQQQAGGRDQQEQSQPLLSLFFESMQAERWGPGSSTDSHHLPSKCPQMQRPGSVLLPW